MTVLAIIGSLLFLAIIVWSILAIDDYSKQKYSYAPFSIKNTALMLIPPALLLSTLFFTEKGTAWQENLDNLNTPMPNTLNIISPDPSISEIAKCSGIWEGTWDNPCLQATTIVLEKIDPNEVTAIYSFGSCSGYPAGLRKAFGRITNSSTIILEWGEKELRRVVTLTLVGNKLKAEYRRANGKSKYATLTKVPTSAPKIP